MRKELNVYFVNKKTGKVYWSNAMWENGDTPHNCVLELSEYPGLYRGSKIPYDYIDLSNYHIIPGAVLEFIAMVDRKKKIKNSSKLCSLAYDTKSLFVYPVKAEQYDAIVKHYRDCGE